MKRLRKGSKIHAVCADCHDIVNATMKYKRYHVDGHYIPHVLMGCCNRCGDAVALPHQEVKKIWKFRRKWDVK